MSTRIGSTKKQSPEALAAEAATRLCALSRPTDHVVTLCPQGVLSIERAQDAVEDDILGAYNPADHAVPRWIGLTRAILADLRHELGARGVS